MTTILQAFERSAAQKKEKISTVTAFCKSRKVPVVLQKKLTAYLDAKWEMTKGLDDAGVFSQLPGQLSISILNEMYKESLLKDNHRATIVANCSPEAAKALLLKAQPEVGAEHSARTQPAAALPGARSAEHRLPNRAAHAVPRRST